jgi:hypothetical protein
VTQKKEQLDQWFHNRYTNGLYADAGIGYKFGFEGKGHWVISTGYSYKNITRYYEVSAACPTNRCYESYNTYKSYLHRLSVKLGFQF